MKLTEIENYSLKGEYNFADGHARYLPLVLENYITSNISNIFKLTDYKRQKETEYNFLSNFMLLAGQYNVDVYNNAIFAPSASISIEIIAHYLKIERKSVGLIEPTFDNIADILVRNNINLIPVDEILISGDISEHLSKLKIDALFLVFPNNPTGFTISNKKFIEIVSYCVKKNILLIIDISFRFFDKELTYWQQYSILHESGVSFIMIEDTGKTWATKELKTSCIISDKTSFDKLNNIFNDLFLCHSPFILQLLSTLIKLTFENGIEIITQPIKKNRQLLRSMIDKNHFEISEKNQSSVEWIKILNKVTDMQLVKILHSSNIYVLPGKQFYWSRRKKRVNKYIRIALHREPFSFKTGITKLSELIAIHAGTVH